MSTTLTLEQRTQTLGPDSFAVLMPQFEEVHLISKLQSERLTNEQLRDQWFHTGDGSVYGLKEDNVMLYWTDFANNPLMKDPKTAAEALRRQRNFFVNPTDAKSLEAKADPSNGVMAFNLSSQGFQKHLQRDNDESSYVEVSTAKLAEGRKAFKQEYGEEVTALFDRVHGNAIYGENGIGALLLKEKKKNTRIYVPNPEYVKKALKSKESGTMLARASYLYFGGCSSVFLDGRNVGDLSLVRGVVKETAEGGAPQKNATIVLDTQQELIPYGDALKIVTERYAPKTSPLFPVFEGLLKEIYRTK